MVYGLLRSASTVEPFNACISYPHITYSLFGVSYTGQFGIMLGWSGVMLPPPEELLQIDTWRSLLMKFEPIRQLLKEN